MPEEKLQTLSLQVINGSEPECSADDPVPTSGIRGHGRHFPAV